MRAGPDRRTTEKVRGSGGERARKMKGGDGARGEQRDGKRSACCVLFSGVGKAGERQARTAARDAEYERWVWGEEREGEGERDEGWSSSIPDASVPEVLMPLYYVIASMM